MTTAAQKEAAWRAGWRAAHDAASAARLDPYPVYVTDAELGGGGGGAAAGTAIVRAFPFAFDTPNLLTGAALYTPTVGDVLLDAWFEIDTAWDGTTPQGDLSTFNGWSRGLFYNTLPGDTAIDMTSADFHGSGNALLIGSGSLTLSAAGVLADVVYGMEAASAPDLSFKNANQLLSLNRIVPLKFTGADPIKVCVSQTGGIDGASPGSTRGAAVLYLVTCTPA